MKKILIIILVTIISISASEYDVVGLKIYREGDNTITEVLTSGPSSIKTARLQNPDRLLIDLIGGIHRLKDKNIPPLPPGIVVEARSAQFQSDPPITRIVFVLAEPTGEISSSDGPRSGKVIVPTPGYPDFTEWSISRATPADKIKVKPISETEEAPKEVKTEAKPIKEKSETQKTSEPPSSIKKPRPTRRVHEEQVQKAFISGDSLGEGASYIRPLVVYRGWDFPDPFVVAKPATESKLGEEAFPIVEDLMLVGVVAGRGINKIAVLQDARGWGYIYGTGDSIKGGIISEISDTTVTFNIEEFGVIRQVTLSLPKEVKDR
ncbi:AMIN domain-containing protein [bacterium]|nr:AMIN domain-containing protein [bacterium]